MELSKRQLDLLFNEKHLVNILLEYYVADIHDKIDMIIFDGIKKPSTFSSEIYDIDDIISNVVCLEYVDHCEYCYDSEKFGYDYVLLSDDFVVICFKTDTGKLLKFGIHMYVFIDAEVTSMEYERFIKKDVKEAFYRITEYYKKLHWE